MNEKCFAEAGGKLLGGFPMMHAPVLRTSAGVPYLQKPGVVMFGKPQINPQVMQGFLDGFDKELEFNQYLDDPTALTDGTQLSKIAGQLCYMSFSPKRTTNDKAEQYFENIKSSGHGSVLEHPNYSFLIYGNSRSETHEQVRHRSGFGYSQVSQRYVSGRVLRFIERPEYQAVPDLHERFLNRIERSAEEYAYIANRLIELQAGGTQILSADAKTDLRKKVQQCARSVLPNETEAAIVVTGNARAWRHFIEMRASEHAEVEIREIGFRIFLCLAMVDPIIFKDYEIKELGDGTKVVATKFRKV